MKTVREYDTIHHKNKQTGKLQTITQRDLQMKDWGFSFLVDSELDAYKAAYEYKEMPHGVRVNYAVGAGAWMVTVFNEFAAKHGLNK